MSKDGNIQMEPKRDAEVESDLQAAATATGAASEAANAAASAEQSSSDASGAALDATVAAAAATAAAINQGQLIETVTSAAREDAERARSQAESAAEEASHQAELAGTVAEYTIAQVAQMLEEHNNRLNALETRPTVVQENSGVSAINPQQVENSARESSMQEGNEEPSSGKRSHGRRRR